MCVEGYGVNPNERTLNTLNRDLSICSGKANSIHHSSPRPWLLVPPRSFVHCCSSAWIEEQQEQRRAAFPSHLLQYDSPPGRTRKHVYATRPTSEAYPEQWWELVKQDKLQPQPPGRAAVRPRDSNT